MILKASLGRVGRFRIKFNQLVSSYENEAKFVAATIDKGILKSIISGFGIANPE